MDKDEQVGEPSKRRSPRSGKRKKKEDAGDSSRDSSAHRSPIKRVKRKRVQTGPSTPQGKRKVSFKCAPYMLFDFLKKLTVNQIAWVNQLGFGALLRMPEVRLPKDLSLWLIDQVDWKRKCLIVRGRPINIKKQIKRLIDLPAGKFNVPPPQSANIKIRKPVGEEKELKDAEKSIQDFIVILLAINEKDKFKRWFMFAVLCIYLAPASGLIINRNYMLTLANVELVKKMDWCSFIADYLIDGIRKYRESPAANVNVHGCIHILLLIYISVVKTEMIDLPKEGYLAEHVNTYMLSYLESIDKIFLDNGFTFGKLEVDTSLFEDGDGSCDVQPVYPRVAQTQILASNHMSPLMNSTTNQRADLPDSSGTSNPSEGSMIMKDIQKIIEKLEAEYSKKREEMTKKWTKVLNNNLKKLEIKWRAELARVLASYKQNNPGSNNSANARTDLLDSGGGRIFRSDQHSNAQDTTSNLHSRPDLNPEDVDNTEHTLLIQDSTHADDLHSEGDSN